MKVMIIEDNKLNSRLTQKVLESAGWEVQIYSNAEAALDKVNIAQPDIILIDLQLPGISGYDFARQIRRFERFASIPIIAVSANVREEDKSNASDSGCDGFIEKPINTRTLVQQIEEILGNKS